jgi:serine/threonine protein kinase
MDSERWRRIEELYHSALDRAVNQRSAFLAEACKDDDELRRQLELLLSQSDSSDTALGRPVWEVVARVAETSVGLTAGTRLGPYEIRGPLGEGAMGTVYRALDTRLGRGVAIKVSSERFSARFEREARAISALNHPNICTLYDVGSNYLVLELVEGETLARRLDRVGPLALEEMLDIALQIAEALEAAHGQGIVHCDLKPANVKITPAGRVKVLDFGLAKALREDRIEESGPFLTDGAAPATLTGQVLGTPAYMSPEQARGSDVDTRTDVWAFGCLVYELLTGKQVFRAVTSADTITAVLEGEPDWHALPSSTPSKIRKLLRDCLEKDTGRRLQDIGAARAAIADVAKAAAQPRIWGRAAAVSTLVVAAGLAVWFLRGPKVPPDETLHAVPLTTYPGTQDWPSFSPDGNQLAFAWDGEKQDNFDIYVKGIGPEPPLRVTHDPAADMAPAWSPDGKTIAFLRASRPGTSSVVLVSPLGGPERVVGEVIRFEPMNQGLGWSPDANG